MNREELIQAICTMGSKDRNNPCPCGSGKKFKKCCQIGVDATKQMIKMEDNRERERRLNKQTNKEATDECQARTD